MPFTVVFEGEISKLVGNPMKYETIFGKVIACGRTNALDEVEALHDEIERLETALSVSNGT